jgi:hypothetical protein
MIQIGIGCQFSGRCTAVRGGGRGPCCDDAGGPHVKKMCEATQRYTSKKIGEYSSVF